MGKKLYHLRERWDDGMTVDVDTFVKIINANKKNLHQMFFWMRAVTNIFIRGKFEVMEWNDSKLQPPFTLMIYQYASDKETHGQMERRGNEWQLTAQSFGKCEARFKKPIKGGITQLVLDPMFDPMTGTRVGREVLHAKKNMRASSKKYPPSKESKLRAALKASEKATKKSLVNITYKTIPVTIVYGKNTASITGVGLTNTDVKVIADANLGGSWEVMDYFKMETGEDQWRIHKIAVSKKAPAGTSKATTEEKPAATTEEHKAKKKRE